MSSNDKQQAAPLSVAREKTTMRNELKFNDWIIEKRKKKQLHGVVEDRLIKILNKVFPDYHPVKEPQGLAGGRNDLILFKFNGRKVLFEIFASRTQVTRDLRILDKTKADVKIAVLIDKDIDSKIIDKFFKENPEDNYPYIFIGELFVKSQINQCALKLNELISGEEEAIFRRILNQKLKTTDFIEACKKEGIDILSPKDLKTKNITFKKVFLAIFLSKLSKFINREPAKNLLKWISDDKAIDFILMKVSHGFNTFLYTDLGGNKGIYSDIELLDWLRIGYQSSSPYLLISMNGIISEIFQKYHKSNEYNDFGKKISFYVGQSEIHDSDHGRSVIYSIPRKTNQIKIFRPMIFDEAQKEYSKEEYYQMIELY
jgi:hypothetical protein